LDVLIFDGNHSNLIIFWLCFVPATIMAGTFLAITRQPLELESCPNLLRIRDVF